MSQLNNTIHINLLTYSLSGWQWWPANVFVCFRSTDGSRHCSEWDS